jgi:hypothetical protein
MITCNSPKKNKRQNKALVTGYWLMKASPVIPIMLQMIIYEINLQFAA